MANATYGGFWIRFGAAIIDTLLLMLVISPLLTLFYGANYWTAGIQVMGPIDIMLNYLMPAAIIIGFWIYKSATPGKMVTSLTIVDAKTGGKPTNGRLVLRYLGYIVSSLFFCLGFIWVAFDKRKQGWHDKIAGTVVIREIEDEWDDPELDKL